MPCVGQRSVVVRLTAVVVFSLLAIFAATPHPGAPMVPVITYDFSTKSSPAYTTPPTYWETPLYWPYTQAAAPAQFPDLITAEYVDIVGGRLSYYNPGPSNTSNAVVAGVVFGPAVSSPRFSFNIDELFHMRDGRTVYFESDVNFDQDIFDNDDIPYAPIVAFYSKSLFGGWFTVALTDTTGAPSGDINMDVEWAGGYVTAHTFARGDIAGLTGATFRVEVTPSTLVNPSDDQDYNVNADGRIRVWLNGVLLYSNDAAPDLVQYQNPMASNLELYEVGAVALGYSGFVGSYGSFVFGYIEPVVTDGDAVIPLIILEACFGIAPSGKSGYRNWVKEHANVVAHWYLSDVGPVGAEDLIIPNDAGIYNGGVGKNRGLLPEFGLSSEFDGVDDFVEVDYDSFGLGTDDPFTFTALIRPTSVTSVADRCVHMSGNTGGYLGLDTTGHPTFGINGGTKVTLAEPVEALGEYLLVGRFDGTNCRLDVYDLINLRTTNPLKRGVLLGTAGPTAISVGPHGGSPAYIGKGGGGGE